jgi:lipopolysaccharide assembly outer membrane protein LptD (OstA)
LKSDLAGTGEFFPVTEVPVSEILVIGVLGTEVQLIKENFLLTVCMKGNDLRLLRKPAFLVGFCVKFSILSIVCLSLLLFFFFPRQSRADAFISEDRVYYGADSYTIDYEREIIRAKGHAYFEKGSRKVQAERIEIYYAENMKKALFFRNVIVQDSSQESEVRGEYGEAFYNMNVYRIEGNAVFTDPRRRVSAQMIEQRKDNETIFSESVVFTDSEYEIRAPRLLITRKIAQFASGASLLDLASGDTVHCNTIEYQFSSGNVTCQGDVLYQQKETKEVTEPLVMISKGVRYFHEGDFFLLLGDVFVMKGAISLNTDVARYERSGGMLEARGDVVVREHDRYVFCENLSYDIDKKKLIYSNSVRGIIPRD